MKSFLKEYPLSPMGFNFPQLNILYSGCEQCEPGYRYGPAVRNCYLIHYVLKGEGTLYFDDMVFHVHAGQAFLVEPGYVTCYEASSQNPWEYIWINFDGEYAERLLESAELSQFVPVFPKEFNPRLENIFVNLAHMLREGSADELYVLGSLMQVFSCIADLPGHVQKKYPKRTVYVKRAMSYIDNNFNLPLTVESVAQLLRLDRKYFCAIFKEETGLSPIQYIQNQRVNRACSLLKTTNHSVSEIGRSVGYEDLFTFSRMFRQQTGTSPSKYRQNNK